jgi:hypothetical protein
VGGQELTQSPQAGIGDLGVAQAGLELGSGQVEHGDTERPGGGDAFESRNGQLQRGIDTSWRVHAAVTLGEQPAIVNDEDLAARGVGGVDEHVDPENALGQVKGMVCEVTLGVGHRSHRVPSWVVSGAALPRVRRADHRCRRGGRAGC